jgi:hypothetical protein
MLYNWPSPSIWLKETCNNMTNHPVETAYGWIYFDYTPNSHVLLEEKLTSALRFVKGKQIIG